jgi:endogenous inhibitor of DNA gyrase (YacG/DUF329 family)
MSNTILLDCPQCGRKIRIAGASGTIHVTCPGCGEQWDWPSRGAGSRQSASRGWSALLKMRFSAAQLAVALVVGIGIGILAGVQYELYNIASSEPDPESLALPSVPSPGEPAAGPVSKRSGKNPIIDDTNANLQDIDVPEPGK